MFIFFRLLFVGADCFRVEVPDFEEVERDAAFVCSARPLGVLSEAKH